MPLAFGLSVAAAAISLTIATSGATATATPRSTSTVHQGTDRRGGISPASSNATRHRRHYTVQPGDSFWTIANSHHVDWYNLAADNGLQMYAVLNAGQVLVLPERGEKPHAPMPLEPGEATTSTMASGSTTASSPEVSSASGTSSFEQCVISRESNGDPDVTNSAGYWGLFQFSESTWAAYGGSPADFGGASAAEQEQVFDNAVASGGESNWAPFDGC
jgi:LysM repeat protein